MQTLLTPILACTLLLLSSQSGLAQVLYEDSFTLNATRTNGSLVSGDVEVDNTESGPHAYIANGATSARYTFSTASNGTYNAGATTGVISRSDASTSNLLLELAPEILAADTVTMGLDILPADALSSSDSNGVFWGISLTSASNQNYYNASSNNIRVGIGRLSAASGGSYVLEIQQRAGNSVVFNLDGFESFSASDWNSLTVVWSTEINTFSVSLNGVELISDYTASVGLSIAYAGVESVQNNSANGGVSVTSYLDNYNVAIPEPTTTAAMMGGGLLLVCFWRKRMRSHVSNGQ